VHGLDVQIEREVPILFGALEHRAVVDEAGGVHEHVDGADLAGEPRDGFGRARIERAALRPVQAFKPGLIEIGGPDGCTLAQKAFSNGAPDPLPRCGHNRDLAVQTPAHRILRSVEYLNHGRA